MPTPKLSVSKKNFDAQYEKLRIVADKCTSLSPDVRGLVAELVTIRLYELAISVHEEATLKLVCGAQYKDNSLAQVNITSGSMKGAENLLLSHNRQKNLRFLRWATENDITSGLGKVFDSNDRHFNTCKLNITQLTDLRHVRNHYAHRKKSTKVKYDKVLERTYNAKVNFRSEVFLLSDKRVSIPTLQRYFATVKVKVNDLFL